MSQSSQSSASPATSIYATILTMDESELQAFRQRLRRRYSREELLEELKACAHRVGQSPTMREFAEDTQATIHPQTIVEHFGSWNAAKREAGLMPRRRANRDELAAALRSFGESLGHVPTARDIDDARGQVPSKAVYIKSFGSLRDALIAAGFDAPTRDERMARSIDHGAAFLLRTGRLPSFRDWERIRGGRSDVMTAWQLYRMFDRLGGAWSAFQFAVDERASQLRADAVVAA